MNIEGFILTANWLVRCTCDNHLGFTQVRTVSYIMNFSQTVSLTPNMGPATELVANKKYAESQTLCSYGP